MKKQIEKKSTLGFLYYFLNYVFVCAHTYKYKYIKKNRKWSSAINNDYF